MRKVLSIKYKVLRSSGFTLVETLLAGLLSLVVGTFLVGILANQSGFFYKENSTINQGISSNSALTAITDEIRQSSQVAVGYPESSPTYITGVGIIVLKLPALSSSGTLDGIFDYAVISADSSNSHILRLKIFPTLPSTRPSVNTVLATNLGSLNFSYLDKQGSVVTAPSAFQVQTILTIVSSTGSIKSERSSTAITSLRNLSP